MYPKCKGLRHSFTANNIQEYAKRTLTTNNTSNNKKQYKIPNSFLPLHTKPFNLLETN